MSKIYLTHCSAKKNDAPRGTGRKVTPDLLYSATPTRRFMERCERKRGQWAIFSDHYGVWLAKEEREWYGDDVGDPNRVTEERFWRLVDNFDERLADFDVIYFYHNPGRFHPIYKRLLDETRLKSRVVLITHLREIMR